eukprot:gene20194-20100_t
MHLSAMGHGEWVAVVDANFTADFLGKGKALVRLPGHSLERLLELEGLSDSRVEAVERFAFYEKIKGASVIVQSGEATAYGNAILSTYLGLISAAADHGMSELMLQLPQSNAEQAREWLKALQPAAQARNVLLTIKLPC